VSLFSSRNTLRGAALLATWLVVAACMALPARAQSSPGPGAPAADAPQAEAPLVGRVKVAGNVFTDSLRILRTFDVAPGSRFSADAVRRGTRKLTALGLFSNVRVLRNEHDGVIDLTVEVSERPRLGAVKFAFTGAHKREDVDLQRKVFLRTGETYSVALVQTQVDSLLQYYRDEGFPRAKVAPHTDTLATHSEVALTFQVEEGQKFRITRVEFKGASAFPVARLRKVMKTHRKGFFGGGELKDESFPEDREKLEAFYHDHGYRDMRVEDFSTRHDSLPEDKPAALTLVVTVDEGQPYDFGKVTWTGNKVVQAPALQKLWGRARSGRYDHSRIEQVMSSVYGEYAEHGYLYVQVEPRESVRDSVVDLEFAVSEGAPAHIRLVSITGNKGTREHVIRRELDVHEGDLFRRSALMRSRDDLMRLGLFEEANPDFSPAESSDVDLVFKVKEKQVGTASAGAGYTGTTGLTGFLELGHNNVLGNGQQLGLHLERGANVENYSLSFTEPWFHDSPTLLGFSAYSTTTILTEFDERRRGASARIGRPLPWPDYSRGSLSYTLEKIRITNVRDSISLTGITIGKDQLTSSLEMNFSRNSADHPMYPTHGTRLTLNDDFTGGPLFGDLNFHSHRLEGRIWLPSINKRFTTMARLRVGAVGQYPWKDGPVPDYARFRLGGGNTLDPLRGYMDYQVVPPRYITKVWVFSSSVIRNAANTADSITVRDSSQTTRRYPGGRYLELFTLEQQFPVVHPLHGVLFFDAGNVWDSGRDIQPFKLKCGAGFGFRMEIPILGNVGFDYGYGFNRDDKAQWQGHFLLGNVGF
jgi:outer membrane protein insertion porin family